MIVPRFVSSLSELNTVNTRDAQRLVMESSCRQLLRSAFVSRIINFFLLVFQKKKETRRRSRWQSYFVKCKSGESHAFLASISLGYACRFDLFGSESNICRSEPSSKFSSFVSSTIRKFNVSVYPFA